MKKQFLIYIVAVTGFVALSFVQTGTQPECNQKELKNKCKALLEPFKYDNAKVTRIVYKPKKQQKELEVDLFIGEKYKIVFCTSGMNKKIPITIYNKSKDANKREALFTNKDIPESQTEFAFEPKRSSKIYVDYDIPATAGDSIAGGCIAFMLGFK